ncbi:hypothetical protein ILUMI_06995 [Ignelater luminosus]|uniref:Tetraspanin n=1 Tax=Ignelater luminosus TaxID=2038154 RepID=A0A8K0DA36_IGNLU|nr:hypothetical protein ILUMI_06995 [Ignelater luminosus]
MCGCATVLVKYILFLFNLLFVLGAIAFIALGVVFKLNIDEVTEALEKNNINFSIAPTLAIVVGCVVFVIAFFGCCGAIRESTCMLTTYAIILLTIFILQVALGVYAFLQYKDSNEEIRRDISQELTKTFNKYNPNKNTEVEEAVDVLQSKLECCGPENPNFWNGKFTGNAAPSSCCPGEPADCRIGAGAYSEGCVPKLFSFLEDSVKIVGIVVIVIAAVELGGAIIALCLSSSIRNAERRGNYA